jgi:GTP-binding protein
MEGIPRDGLPQIAMTGRSNVGKSTLLNALCRAKVARTSAAPGKTRLANVYRVVVEGGGPGPEFAEATAGRRRSGGGGKWSLYLVDLPGYGYARGGGSAAEELRAVAERYFAFRGPQSALRGPESSGATTAHRAKGGQRTQGVTDSRPRATDREDVADRGSRTAARGRAALLLVDSRHPGLESDIQAAHWLTAMHVGFRVVATKIDKLSRSERARNLKALELTFGMPALPVSAASGEGMDTLWKTIASLARTGHA